MQMEFNAQDSSGLNFVMENVNFLKNNEFFNDYVKGYTLLGFYINPQLRWKITPKTKLTGGVHLLKYSGVSRFQEIKPLFRIEQNLTDSLKLIMGNIFQNHNHHFIDPLYHSEKSLNEPLETGIQFLFKRPFLNADIWLNWKNFILYNAPSQEKFEAGAYLSPRVAENSKFSAHVPVQFLARHKGGQIDTTGKPLQSIINVAAGPKLAFKIQSPFLNKIELESYFAKYKDISPEPQLASHQGEAAYNRISASRDNWFLGIAYWYANKFIPISGNPIYSTLSSQDNLTPESRELITGELRYTYHYKKATLIFGIQTYFDPIQNETDHSFGLYLKLSPEVFLTKLTAE